jgi:hypothetical protein
MNDDYAILVGIDNYAKTADEAASFSPLTSAVGDANAFMRWLVSPTGGAIENDPTPNIRRIIPIFSPTVLNDQLPSPMEAKPVKDQIDDALIEFGFTEAKRPVGRRLYFYFSGHGIGLGSGDVALMMANSFRAMENRNIALRPYREYLQERFLFEEVVFIADCCRNRETKPVDPGKPSFTIDRDQETPPMQDVAILAAEYGEPSFALSGGQGLLTKALIEGLNGDPQAVDQMGRVTSNTLNNFIPKRVQALAKENLVKQSPVINFFPQTSEIIFCKPKNKVKIKIVADASIKGELFVCNGNKEEIAGIGRREAKDATAATPWEVELIDSFVPYFVRSTKSNTPFMLELSVVKENDNVFQIP